VHDKPARTESDVRTPLAARPRRLGAAGYRSPRCPRAGRPTLYRRVYESRHHDLLTRMPAPAAGPLTPPASSRVTVPPPGDLVVPVKMTGPWNWPAGRTNTEKSAFPPIFFSRSPDLATLAECALCNLSAAEETLLVYLEAPARLGHLKR